MKSLSTRANGTSLAGLATAAVLATGSVQAEKAPDFSELVNAGGPRVQVIQTNTRMANERLVSDTQPILLAQAAVETDGKVYYADVIQIDGSKKAIKYYRNLRGAIIPPPVVDGKLVDGSDAPDNAAEARIAQRKILVKYDKEALLALALVSEDDFLRKSDKDLKEIVALTKRGDILTREQLFNGFFSVHIVKLGLDHKGIKDLISGLESIAKIKMRMSESEISQIKREAETKANSKWRAATGDKRQ